MPGVWTWGVFLRALVLTQFADLVKPVQCFQGDKNIYNNNK